MFSSPQINVYARDIERSLAFYRGLGFEETFRTPREGKPDHVELVLDRFKLGVASALAAARDHGVEIALDERGRGIEVVLWVDDADGAFERLTADGAEAVSAPHDWLGSLRVAWVADPDGNPIQLVERRS